MINLRNSVWAVDYDLIGGFRSFVVGLVGWRFQMAVVVVVRHELHAILCLGEKRSRKCEGRTRRRKGGEQTERRTEEGGGGQIWNISTRLLHWGVNLRTPYDYNMI